MMFLAERKRFNRPRGVSTNPYLTAALVGTAGLVASAIINRFLAKKAERDNPPTGRFINVDGVDLHYVERGVGLAVVLLHGNGSMIQDFGSSGLIDAVARDHRVVVFDRPGFGHTNRPRNAVKWGPNEQADLIKIALERLGIQNAIIVGHSWGASVAVAMGLRHPASVHALVLVSGYYYPSFRPDFAAMSAPAVPVIGNLMSVTVSPIVSRLMWPALVAKLFGPAAVPAKFRRFPKEMAVRPSQIHAAAEESGLLVLNAARSQAHYKELSMPVSIIAGQNDRLIDPISQSGRLHDDVAQSRFHPIPETGHMVHQTATQSVVDAIGEVSTPASAVDK
ncbi:alpha/beta fold hydrolase [Tardiphaga sp. 172_B4_N1_3]|uniref:alpha/beta fold hydrolase n=1 Tax=Tardiphaga sp. 172_B4_N1_3 TaxID=3240787 RepID=UPI003F8BAF5C